MVAGGRELIDTLWNVNKDNKEKPAWGDWELIDTLWNVNGCLIQNKTLISLN